MKSTDRFSEWSQPKFETIVYADRRRRMLDLLQEDEGVMLIPSREGQGNATFRQNNNFLYFTGMEWPDSVLVLDSLKGEICYLPNRDRRFDSDVRPNDFSGRLLFDDADSLGISGIAQLCSMDDFASLMKSLQDRIIYLPVCNYTGINALKCDLFRPWNSEQHFAKFITSKYSAYEFKDAYAKISKLRMIKGKEEIETIRRAVEITEDSILETLKYVKEGIDERTISGILECAFKKRGAQRPAFDPIIKTGLNSFSPWRILSSHYERRNQQVVANDVVIFDVGAEFDYYASDIGRTFPVHSFSTKQTDAIDRVADAIDAVKESIKPGVLLGDLRDAAWSAVDSKYHKFMQVDSYFGHHIGLSSGDPSELDMPIEAGMVFTIEPWYYNHEECCSVFTEENIAVTETGFDLLSARIPYRASELQKVRCGDLIV